VVPTYDGVPIFGVAVRVQDRPHAAAVQINAYFGIDGLTSLYGGSRGRELHISGCLIAEDLEGLVAAEQLLLSYADGLARTLIDPVGREFNNVIFKGEYEPFAEGPKFTDGGVILPYRAVFHGLT
jgi:hypothetical protein